MKIGSKPAVVGRGDHADLVIDDPSVSSTHAEVVRRGGLIHVKDLGSTNGTFVNSNRISAETELHDGDLVRFGEAEFELRDGALTELEPEIERTQITSPSGPAASPASPPSEPEASGRQFNPMMSAAVAALVVAGIVLAVVLTNSSSDDGLTSAESAYIDVRVEEIRTGNFDSSSSINFASSKGMTPSEARCVLEGLFEEFELSKVREQFDRGVPDAAFARAVVEGVSGCADLRSIMVADIPLGEGDPEEVFACTLAEISDEDVINLKVAGILAGDEEETAALIEAGKPVAGPLYACGADLLSVEEFFGLTLG